MYLVGVMAEKEYESEGGPCRRKCDIDMKTLKCRSCGLSYKLPSD